MRVARFSGKEREDGAASARGPTCPTNAAVRHRLPGHSHRAELSFHFEEYFIPTISDDFTVASGTNEVTLGDSVRFTDNVIGNESWSFLPS